jgi:hypothetical protein
MKEVRRRGKGKKGALRLISIRVPTIVWEYYSSSPLPTTKIRHTLEEHVKKELDKVNICGNVPSQ